MDYPKSLKEAIELRNAAEVEYREGNSIMSDEEFDLLERYIGDEVTSIQDQEIDSSTEVDRVEYHKAITESGISTDIANFWLKNFGKEMSHTLPMGSLDKALNLEEMESYYTRIKDLKQEQAYTTKMDGLSAELTYVHGLLTQILTRGDGQVGADITAIAFQSQQIPYRIITKEKQIVVRGEIMLFKQDLVDMNVDLDKMGRKEYKTTRNGAVGVIKSLKNFVFGPRLTFFIYLIKTSAI